ncbi:hypothetical protein BDD12DRAFT_406723 [Trichophaea hybrida]|nr:hypothetical protein BDD12DRAFT_406723 [Trichophaea hybrida]
MTPIPSQLHSDVIAYSSRGYVFHGSRQRSTHDLWSRQRQKFQFFHIMDHSNYIHQMCGWSSSPKLGARCQSGPSSRKRSTPGGCGRGT